MSRLTMVGGAVLWASMVWVSVVTGQAAPTDTTAATPPPFVEGGAYDKPFLTHLLGRTALGGYAEMHARWARADGVTEEAGFELKRWNLFTSTEVSEFVRIGAELEFEDLAEEIVLEYAAIDVRFHPLFTLRAGAILSPLGRFNLSHDSPRNEFTDRPLVSTEIIGTALTEAGLGGLGLVQVGGGRVTYELYAVNGFHEGLIKDSPGGTRIPLGKGAFTDNNASPAVVGRLAWSPALGYEVGVSGHTGAYNVFQTDGEIVADRYDLTILALDAEARVGAVDFSGEGVVARVDVPEGLAGIYASDQYGFYLQGVSDWGHGLVSAMPGSYFEAGARLDAVDFDRDLGGDSSVRFTLGVNFRVSSDTVLKLNYLRGRGRDRFNNPAEEAGVLFSVATYF
jgi:hypothetical protein